MNNVTDVPFIESNSFYKGAVLTWLCRAFNSNCMLIMQLIVKASF